MILPLLVLGLVVDRPESLSLLRSKLKFIGQVGDVLALQTLQGPLPELLDALLEFPSLFTLLLRLGAQAQHHEQSGYRK